MAASPARILWQAMVLLGAFDGPAGGDTGWRAVASGPMPQDGDRYVALTNTGGYLLGRTSRDGLPVLKPTVQLVVRSSNVDDEGWVKGVEVINRLSGVGVIASDANPYGIGGALPLVVDGDDWAILSVSVMTYLMPVGYTKDRRLQIFTANLCASLQPLGPGVADKLWPVGGYA